MPAVNYLSGRVAVLMGGTASEREISLQSGMAVLNSLQASGIDAVGIDTAGDLLADLEKTHPVFAFIAVHGAGGEDGKLQAVLELLGIPYSGSGVMASALAMDKLRSKHIWKGLGLPTPPYKLLQDSMSREDLEAALAQLGGRVFVKPIAEGSSFGMAIASSSTELHDAFRQASLFNQPVMAERLVSGPEYTVAILNKRCLPSIRIQASQEFYDFQAKYESDETRFFIPSGLDNDAENRLQTIALAAFEALGCVGWGRVDVMQDELSGDFYLLEVNTVPGLTDHSLVPMAANAAGLSFADLIGEIINACAAK